MMDPPPPFANAQVVFAIARDVGMSSLNSRFLLSGEDRRFWMDIGQVNSFFEVLLFFFIDPLDNLYLSGGQVVEFVDELVVLFFKVFYLGLFSWVFEVIY